VSVKKRVGLLAWLVLSAAFFAGPLLLAKAFIPPWAGLAIALIPCAAIICFVFSRLRTLQSKIFLTATVSVALYGLTETNLLSPEIVFLFNFSLINGFFFWVFARTLAFGNIPLCTRFADLVHEKMSSEVSSYTRGLTYAWASFFAIQLIIWVALFITLPKPFWYQLVTIVPPCLICAMFFGDWIFRQFTLPYEDRKDAIRLTIKALIKHRQILGKTITK
jgi:uncharacterized membrane protein